MSEIGFSHPFDADKLHEECGVFGIFGHEDAGPLTALGLHALQHRGQEAAGIVSYDGNQFYNERHIGLVSDNFTKHSVIERLKGNRAIGHTRYSTTGAPVLRNVQPLFAEFHGGGFAVAHNGNITNARTLQRNLQRRGRDLPVHIRHRNAAAPDRDGRGLPAHRPADLRDAPA